MKMIWIVMGLCVSVLVQGGMLREKGGVMVNHDVVPGVAPIARRLEEKTLPPVCWPPDPNTIDGKARLGNQPSQCPKEKKHARVQLTAFLLQFFIPSAGLFYYRLVGMASCLLVLIILTAAVPFLTRIGGQACSQVAEDELELKQQKQFRYGLLAGAVILGCCALGFHIYALVAIGNGTLWPGDLCLVDCNMILKDGKATSS